MYPSGKGRHVAFVLGSTTVQGRFVVSTSMLRKRSLIVAIAAFAAALCIAFVANAQPAQAKVVILGGLDDTPITKDSMNAEPTQEYNMGTFYSVKTSTDGTVKIKKVTSSKKKIAKVFYEKGQDTFSVYYGPGVGTTTIKVKTNKGTAKMKFKVKYTCPVKSFKVAGKSYTKKFKKSPLFKTKKTLKNKKVTVKAKKYWVITSVSTEKWSNSKGPIYKDKSINDKKSYSGKVTVRYPLGGITINFRNTKTDEEQSISFTRNTDDLARQAG